MQQRGRMSHAALPNASLWVGLQVPKALEQAGEGRGMRHQGQAACKGLGKWGDWPGSSTSPALTAQLHMASTPELATCRTDSAGAMSKADVPRQLHPMAGCTPAHNVPIKPHSRCSPTDPPQSWPHPSTQCDPHQAANSSAGEISATHSLLQPGTTPEPSPPPPQSQGSSPHNLTTPSQCGPL